MIQVNRIYLIFNRLVTKKFLVDTSDPGINSVTAITEKDDGHMWIGTSAGLYLLDLSLIHI